MKGDDDRNERSPTMIGIRVASSRMFGPVGAAIGSLREVYTQT